jgi:hypothetical protein
VPSRAFEGVVMWTIAFEHHQDRSLSLPKTWSNASTDGSRPDASVRESRVG